MLKKEAIERPDAKNLINLFDSIELLLRFKLKSIVLKFFIL